MAPSSLDGRTKVIGHTVLRPRQQVEEAVRAAILSGELKPGEMLPPEAELARQFKVSRTTLREALRSLTAQRLITKVPGAHGGNFVQSVDYRSLGAVMSESVDNLLALGTIQFSEVSAVRQFLEVPSVRLAAANRTDEDLNRLAKVVRRQKTASVEDPTIPQMDREFHTLIARASGNRVLASFVAALHHATEPVHYLDLSPEVGRETVKQHQRILSSVKNQDPDEGETAIIQHLGYIRRHILAYQAGNDGHHGP